MREKRRMNIMIKDLSYIDVLQTKAVRRKKSELHTRTNIRNKGRYDHTSHADNKENNNRSFTIPFFFLIFMFEINQSIDQKFANTHTVFF